MNKNKKVLISGGAGFIGSHTADLLLHKGYRVRILDNLSSKTHNGTWPSYLDRRIEKIKGDVRHKKHWLKALKGVSYVIHLAAWMDMQPELSQFFSINTLGTSNLYEVIITRKLPIKKIVIASSQFVYGQGRWQCSKHGIVFPKTRPESRLKKGQWDLICPFCHKHIKPLPHLETHQDPQNPYSISKYTQELIGLNLGQLYQIPSTALRYSIVHGPRQSLKNAYSGALRQFFLWLSSGQPVNCYEDGQQLRDFVSVFDVANANLIALKSKKTNYQVFNVGGDKRYTVIKLAQMIAQIMGKKLNLNKPGLYRAGDTRHSFSDTKKLKKIGWSPEYTEEQNISQFIQWAQKQNLTKLLSNKIGKQFKKASST